MRAEHLQEKQINVAGHLKDVRGIYHMRLSWYDQDGKRYEKSISTSLPVKGNKKRAEDMLSVARRE